ncbi:hypothetical protein R3P38DRAFT_3549579 [Favolaschia claudopus]|uniref:Uncharacterized protein n=1 Tax=Favolaschia claudopus TaxID=2862362 RepID=A0AAW0B3H4_9AGAR
MAELGSLSFSLSVCSVAFSFSSLGNVWVVYDKESSRAGTGNGGISSDHAYDGFEAVDTDAGGLKCTFLLPSFVLYNSSRACYFGIVCTRIVVCGRYSCLPLRMTLSVSVLAAPSRKASSLLEALVFGSRWLGSYFSGFLLTGRFQGRLSPQHVVIGDALAITRHASSVARTSHRCDFIYRLQTLSVQLTLAMTSIVSMSVPLSVSPSPALPPSVSVPTIPTSPLARGHFYIPDFTSYELEVDAGTGTGVHLHATCLYDVQLWMIRVSTYPAHRYK